MTRSAMLTDLADLIRQLTEERQHVEYLEASIVEERVTRNGRRTIKRTRQRRAHITTLPPLLDALLEAAEPGAGEPGNMAGFESRPAAELEPLSVLREISDDLGFWCRTFGIERDGLPANLRALVSAPHDDAQLAHITRQAARWVKRARIATGLDPAPITLNEPCPYCWRRHALTITGDLRSAKCTRCGVTWTPDTIGLLADMLHNNETLPTMTADPCWMTDCTRTGPHSEHADRRGRTWRDTCDLTPDTLRTNARLTPA